MAAVCAELCYPERYVSLAGTGIYPQASLFNHDCRPNTARFTVGTCVASLRLLSRSAD